MIRESDSQLANIAFAAQKQNRQNHQCYLTGQLQQFTLHCACRASPSLLESSAGNGWIGVAGAPPSSERTIVVQ